jgi:hypothetical protein
MGSKASPSEYKKILLVSWSRLSPTLAVNAANEKDSENSLGRISTTVCDTCLTKFTSFFRPFQGSAFNESFCYTYDKTWRLIMDDFGTDALRNLSDNELIDRYNHATTHGGQIDLILQHRLVERLIRSLNSNSDSANRLSRIIAWLTGVIALATAVYATATVCQVLEVYHQVPK